MGEYLSPGVYVEEYDNSPRTIEGVGTSTAGFVGLADMGATIGAPSLVTNFTSFTKQFGGFLSEFSHEEYRYLANSVEQFFINGGTRCFVARVAPKDAAAAEQTKGVLSIQAANVGKWGNKIQFQIATVTKKKLQLLEKTEDGYRAKSVEGFKEGDLVVAENSYNKIVTIYDKTVTFESEFTGNVVDTAIVPKTVLYLVEYDVQVRYNDTVEVYTGMNFNPTSPYYIGVNRRLRNA